MPYSEHPENRPAERQSDADERSLGTSFISSDELLPLLYNELRRLARTMLAKLPPGQTLQPTALVHEAYLRLALPTDHTWDGRRHFFGAAAQAMRNILVDQARRKAAVKHGGDLTRVELEDIQVDTAHSIADLLELEGLLKQLEQIDPEAAQIVDLRFFGGLTIDEVAEILGSSPATVQRKWRFARAHLYAALADGDHA